MALGKRLALLRMKQGLTQEQVAKQIGVSRSRYSHYETERSEPDLHVLKDLADLFEVTVDYLLSSLDLPCMDGYVKLFGKPQNDNNIILESPILGITKSGNAIYAGEHLLNQNGLTLNLSDERYCYFRSAEEIKKLKIQQGDLILVDKQYPITNGTIAAVNFTKENVIKLRYIYTFNENTLLLPMNPLYEPVQARTQDIDIIGKAIQKIGLI